MQIFPIKINGFHIFKKFALVKIQIKSLVINILTPNTTSQSQTLPLLNKCLSVAIILGFKQKSKQNIAWIHSKKTFRISNYDYRNY